MVYWKGFILKLSRDGEQWEFPSLAVGEGLTVIPWSLWVKLTQ